MCSLAGEQGAWGWGGRHQLVSAITSRYTTTGVTLAGPWSRRSIHMHRAYNAELDLLLVPWCAVLLLVSPPHPPHVDIRYKEPCTTSKLLGQIYFHLTTWAAKTASTFQPSGANNY